MTILPASEAAVLWDKSKRRDITALLVAWFDNPTAPLRRERLMDAMADHELKVRLARTLPPPVRNTPSPTP